MITITTSLFNRSREQRRQLAELLADIRRSGLTCSGNAVACFGERFIADYWQVDLPPACTKGWDVLTPAGERIQVKTMWRNGFNRGHRRGKDNGFVLLNLEECGGWDAIAVVLLDEQLQMGAARHVPRAVALRLLHRYERDRNHRLHWRLIVNHPECWSYPAEEAV